MANIKNFLAAYRDQNYGDKTFNVLLNVFMIQLPFFFCNITSIDSILVGRYIKYDMLNQTKDIIDLFKPFIGRTTFLSSCPYFWPIGNFENFRLYLFIPF